MPIYEYRCKACSEVIEVIQKVNERARRKCEACGGRLEKMVSRSGFVLKGSGWYVTDYKDAGRPSSRSESEGESSSGTEKSTPSTDTKPKGKKTADKDKDKD